MKHVGRLVIGTVLVLVLLVGIVLVWSWTSTRCTSISPVTLSVHSNNVGNLLLEYTQAMAMAFQKRQTFRAQWKNEMQGGEMCALLKRLPAEVTPTAYAFVAQRLATECPTLTMAGCVSQWERRSQVLNIMQPVIRDILRRSVFMFDKPCAECECQCQCDVLIHFRCSDSPFNRHPVYHFLRYDWYGMLLRVWQQRRRSLRDLPNQTCRIIVLNCTSHLSCSAWQEASSRYAADLLQYLSCFGQVQLRCGSIEQDLALMIHAPFLITTGSSMSTMAALARDDWAVLPSTVSEPQLQGPVYERVFYVDASPFRLLHEHVPDYLDVAAVCRQLRQPVENTGMVMQTLRNGLGQLLVERN